MKRLILPLATLLLAASAAAAPDDPVRTVSIREVSVSALRRPMKQIGIQRTEIDTAVLHESISLSMADILSHNSTVFIKQYGRGTEATASFRGTAPEHTQVLWNGMRITSPVMGMTDFSMIPAHFVDEAELLHGTSSLQAAGGGLGGAITLATRPLDTRGPALQYTQGIGSFTTFDEYLRFTYGGRRWQTSTRFSCSTSRNDYRYRNYDKKIFLYDDEHRVTGSYYPVERNRNGEWRDLHLLQEFYFRTRGGDRWSLNAWYLDSKRGLPATTVSYRDDDRIVNEGRERTLRSVAGWERTRTAGRLAAKAGYIYSRTAYDFRNDRGDGTTADMMHVRNRVHTLFADLAGEYRPGERWYFTAAATAHQHFVRSIDHSVVSVGNTPAIGYDKGRIELSLTATARWRPVDRFGLAFTLREELFGDRWSPAVPALFADWVVSERGSVTFKASVSRNYRFPTLTDLYFRPGGNAELRPEHGFTYDAGVSFAAGRPGSWSLTGEATAFDSYIDDWIIRLPMGGSKSFWQPRNMKRVHSYGVETKASLDVRLAAEWRLALDGTFGWTPSINRSEPLGDNDQSVGKQLVYVPEFSSAVTGRLDWRTWRLTYKWNYYSSRYTMSSNDDTLTGRLTPYLMNDVSLEKRFAPRWADLTLRCAVNNLFDEEYKSVLARPMPGIHFEFFLEIRPRFGRR
ncbi:TonB-dependent receptor [uncultured Alistipes sp.]|uniref:TonB-dependent receptor n=2 Tax=uncultured Alistipes sp. TaxID=538949 RepID=UPI0025D5472A|nr:TonB-dependent receptor plug domain-containing protein [uncultured Alistipes sp.]